MNCKDCHATLDIILGYFQDTVTGNLYCKTCGTKYPDAEDPTLKPNRGKQNPRVAALDPGRMKDSFAMVGIEIVESKIIEVIGAAQWKHQEYDTVEKQVALIQKAVAKRPFDYIGVETNNAGWHVVEALRKLQMPILPINTVGKVIDKKKLKIGNSMGKNEMVGWVKRKFLNGEIIFPDKDSVGTLALKNQLPKFTRKLSPSGQLTYSAQGSEHDDLVMAFIIACYIARKKYLRGSMEGVKPLQISQFSNSKTKTDSEKLVSEIRGYNEVTDLNIIEPQ